MSKENPAMVMLEALTPAVKSMHRAILPLNKAMTEQQEMLIRQTKSSDELNHQMLESTGAMELLTRSTPDTLLKAGNAGGKTPAEGILEVGGILIATGAFDTARDAFSNDMSRKTGSLLGGEAEIMVSNIADATMTGMLAGTMLGAKMGSGVPFLGTAIGAAGGLFVGAISGAAENFNNKDDAFKDMVKGQFDKVIAEQQQDMLLGSQLAAVEETNSMLPWRVATDSFLGLTKQLEGLEQDQQIAMGVGYNEERKEGLKDQIYWMSGEQGEKMQESNEYIGAYQASLDNEREMLVLTTKQDKMDSDEYKNALKTVQGLERLENERADKGEMLTEEESMQKSEAAATLGRLLMEAQVEAENEYRKGEGYQLQLATQTTMLTHMRADLSSGWENFGFTMGQEFTLGLGRGQTDAGKLVSAQKRAENGITMLDFGLSTNYLTGDTPDRSYAAAGSKYAFGQRTVPYDNFPALLHQGERVLTASEARAANGGGTAPITITVNGLTVREEADIERIAEELAVQLEKARITYVG